MSEAANRSSLGHFVYDDALGNEEKYIYMTAVNTRPRDFPEGRERLPYQRGIVCFIDEYDPAREKGVSWLRSIGDNTASVQSFNIAKGWFEECLKTESPIGRVRFEWNEERLRSYQLRLIMPGECQNVHRRFK